MNKLHEFLSKRLIYMNFTKHPCLTGTNDSQLELKSKSELIEWEAEWPTYLICKWNHNENIWFEYHKRVKIKFEKIWLFSSRTEIKIDLSSILQSHSPDQTYSISSKPMYHGTARGTSLILFWLWAKRNFNFYRMGHSLPYVFLKGKIMRPCTIASIAEADNTLYLPHVWEWRPTHLSHESLAITLVGHASLRTCDYMASLATLSRVFLNWKAILWYKREAILISYWL